MHISKTLWLKNHCLTFDAATELFYVTTAKGNRHYHYVSIGRHDITEANAKASVTMFTFFFIQFGIGWITNGRK